MLRPKRLHLGIGIVLAAVAGCLQPMAYQGSEFQKAMQQLDDKETVSMYYECSRPVNLDLKNLALPPGQTGQSFMTEISESAAVARTVRASFVVNADNVAKMAYLHEYLTAMGFKPGKDYLRILSYKAPAELRDKARAMIPQIEASIERQLASMDVECGNNKKPGRAICSNRRVSYRFGTITPDHEWSSWCNAATSHLVFPTLGIWFSYWTDAALERDRMAIDKIIESCLKPLTELDPRFQTPLFLASCLLR